MSDYEENEFEATPPAKLAEDLERLYPMPHVPSQVDQTIRSAALRHLRRSRRSRMYIGWSLAGAALAAILVIVPMLHRTDSRRAQAPPDITKALAIAHRLRSGATLETDDINRDGVVDQRDVDAIAMTVVRLKPEVTQ
jgi:hypothetical protein